MTLYPPSAEREEGFAPAPKRQQTSQLEVSKNGQTTCLSFAFSADEPSPWSQ